MIVKKAGTVLVNIKTKEIALVCLDGLYSFPKGHLDEGETFEQCAIRETKEETGHDCQVIRQFNSSITYKTPAGDDIEVIMYLALDLGKTNDIIDEKDKEETVWVKFDNVEKMLSYQNLKDYWDSIKNTVKLYMKEQGK